MGSAVRLFVPVVFQDGIANCDTLVADVGSRIVARRGNQLANDILAFMAEGTTERVVRTSTLHTGSPRLDKKSSLRSAARFAFPDTLIIQQPPRFSHTPGSSTFIIGGFV